MQTPIVPGTHHASRITHHAPKAFTLVELLVVIAIIALLAALTFPIVVAVKRVQTTHRAQAELTQIESAIEAYKTKLGFYPPDNPLTPPNWAINQLYYELMGTTVTLDSSSRPVSYQTLDGSAAVTNFPTAFGAGTPVVGFVNCSKPGAGDDSPNAVKFLFGLKANQFMAITNGAFADPICTLLGSRLDGPLVYQDAFGGKLNPWRYNSSSPHHNAKSFDLWIDVTVGSKTYRIGNWSEKPLTVSPPYLYPSL